MLMNWWWKKLVGMWWTGNASMEHKKPLASGTKMASCGQMAQSGSRRNGRGNQCNQLGQDNLGELFFWRWFVDAVDLGVSRGKGLSFQFCCFLAVLQIDSLCPWGLKVLAYISHNNWWLVYLHRTTTKDESDPLVLSICLHLSSSWCNMMQHFAALRLSKVLPQTMDVH